jgi:prevent-host-death family protein
MKINFEATMNVSVREFKDRLSKYLRLVGEGEPVVITSHNKPVAILNPIARTDKPSLQQLLAAGKLKWSGRRAHIDPHRPVAAIKGKSIAETVLEDRE